MRRFIVAVFLFTATAAAQIHDFGVKRTTDEFTGATTCLQVVSQLEHEHRVSIILVASEGSLLLGVYRYNLDSDDIAHNMFGASPGDTLMLRFAGVDETSHYDIIDAGADVTQGALTWGSRITISANRQLIEQLTSQSEPVRFRIASGGKNYDGALIPEQLAALRAFVSDCL